MMRAHMRARLHRGARVSVFCMSVCLYVSHTLAYYLMPSLRTTSCHHCVLPHAITAYYLMPSLRTISCHHRVLSHAITAYYLMPSLRTTSCHHCVLPHAITSPHMSQSETSSPPVPTQVCTSRALSSIWASWAAMLSVACCCNSFSSTTCNHARAEGGGEGLA